ncbi:carbohydrate sulfotransferase 14-like [Ciona intestinalis]
MDKSMQSHREYVFAQHKRCCTIANHLHHVCDAGIRQGIWEQAERVRRQKTWVQNDNFLVVPGTNFMMCVLPKCGSSSWHWLTRDLREPLSAGHQFGWQDRQKNTQIMQDLSPDDGAKLMSNENAFRGISVRHPFSKLVSGWNQKLARELTYASFLLEAYPHMQEYADDTDKLHVLTFENMAEYIAAYGHDVDNLDYHFLPMEYLCQPCLYPYNYVIKIESMGNDQNWLTHELNVERMPWQEKGPGYFNANQTNPVNILRTYFKNVKRETILKLMDIYYYDFVLFGYTFDVDTLTPGGLV